MSETLIKDEKEEGIAHSSMLMPERIGKERIGV